MVCFLFEQLAKYNNHFYLNVNKVDTLSSSAILDYQLVSLAERVLPRNVLDIGAGYGRWTFLITRHFTMENRPDSTCIDIFEPYARELKKFADNVLMASATHLPFRDKTFDLVILCEVIEHQTKDLGRISISEADRVSKTLIITTPTHPSKQNSYDGNVCQKHVSIWDIF